MDVQTRLIALMCPHCAEYGFWRTGTWWKQTNICRIRISTTKLLQKQVRNKPTTYEIEVLRENIEMIQFQLGLERVEVLNDADVIARAGDHAAVLNSNPPSPGVPSWATSGFMNE